MWSIFQDILSKSGGGVQSPLIYLPQVQGGGGLRPALPQPSYFGAPGTWEYIHSFIHLLYLFMYLLIRLFSYSFILKGI